MEHWETQGGWKVFVHSWALEGVAPIKFGKFIKLEVSAVKEQNIAGEETDGQDDPQRDKIYQVLTSKWIAHLQINRICILINLGRINV